MTRKELKKCSALLLALSLSLNIEKTNAITYDKNEILEETIDDYKNGRKIKEGTKGYYRDILSMRLDDGSSLLGTYDINNSDYPIGCSLFCSDETFDTSLSYCYSKNINDIKLGSYVKINGEAAISCESKDKCYKIGEEIGVVVGIKSDSLNPYAVSAIDKDGSLKEVIGWFKKENLFNIILRKYSNTKKQGDVLRIIACGEQIGYYINDNDELENKYWLPEGFKPLDGTDNCHYGIKTYYQIPNSFNKENNGFRSYDDITLFNGGGSVYVYGIEDDADTTLQIEDVILEVDGIKINNSQDLTNYIRSKNEGDNVVFKVYRKGVITYAYANLKKYSKSLFFNKMNSYLPLITFISLANEAKIYSENPLEINVNVTDVLDKILNPPLLEASVVEYYGFDREAKVLEVANADFYYSNLKNGDIILSIDDKEFKGKDELYGYIATKNSSDIVSIKVKRNNKIEYVNEKLYDKPLDIALIEKGIGLDFDLKQLYNVECHSLAIDSDSFKFQNFYHFGLDATDVLYNTLNYPKIRITVGEIEKPKIAELIDIEKGDRIYYNEDYSKYIRFNEQTGNSEYISIEEQEKIESNEEEIRKLTKRYNIQNN